MIRELLIWSYLKNGKEVTKETIRKLEEAKSLQKQQYLFSIETSKEILKSIAIKLSGREK